jgi:hypothetical protein
MFGRFSNWLVIVLAAAVLAVGARVALSHDHYHQGCGEGHHGCGSATGTGCCDFCDAAVNLDKVATLQGKVEAVNVAADTGYPSVTLRSDGGERVNILVAPQWFLREHNFAVKEGDRLIARVVTTQITQQSRNVAVELEQADGTRLKLRDDRGLALWTKGGGCCHHR